MATALTGSLGWTGLHPVQLGGPPLINTFDRKLPPATAPMSLEGAPATPFIGHAYGNDGVTSVATFGLLNRPTLNPTLANGGFNQILLEVPAPVTGLALGNVVRLSEQGGDGSFVYGGTVEDLPDTISPSGVSHQILVSPFSTELDDTFSQAVYTSPTDITQLVRDAVALTRHCSCDQVSVPASAGILVATTGPLDFRNQSVRSVIDTARSIAGPTWFWHVDEMGRVWFQAMGSAAVYTIPRAQYEQRTKSASIQDRKNKVVVVGAVPAGTSTPVTSTADDATSQTAIGIRALNPPVQVPHIADSAVVSSIASNILTVLNRNWQRVNLKVLPTFGRRIHASQPGGAMVRYWEPVVSPMQESATGISGYTGPFIAQSLANDGLYQQVVAGDIPVTSQTDVQNMVNSLVARTAAMSIQLPGPTLSGYTVMQSTNATYGGGRLSVVDTTPQIRTDFGNLPAYKDPNGVASPAEYGLRAMDASGNLLFDSIGIIAVMKELGRANQSAAFTTNSNSPGVSITGLTTTFSVTRAQRVLVVVEVAGSIPGGAVGQVDLVIDGTDINAQEIVSSPFAADAVVLIATVSTSSGLMAYSATLAAGSHTIKANAFQNAAQIFTVAGSTLVVYGLGT